MATESKLKTGTLRAQAVALYRTIRDCEVHHEVDTIVAAFEAVERETLERVRTLATTATHDCCSHCGMVEAIEAELNRDTEATELPGPPRCCAHSSWVVDEGGKSRCQHCGATFSDIANGRD
jgi:hypothetical protein